METIYPRNGIHIPRYKYGAFLLQVFSLEMIQWGYCHQVGVTTKKGYITLTAMLSYMYNIPLS